MDRRQRTASHLERMILTELRRHAVCDGISAVTVSELSDGKGWELTDIYAPGGVVPAVCRDICMAVVHELRAHYDILPQDQVEEDDSLRMGGV